MRTWLLSITVICAAWFWAAAHTSAQDLPLTSESDSEAGIRTGRVLLFEDFSQGMENWWVEGGHQVQVKDGRLEVDADPPEGTASGGVCTVW